MREVKLISRKRLAKDLIGKYSILNGVKYFVESGSQSYLLFQAISRYFDFFSNTRRIPL